MGVKYPLRYFSPSSQQIVTTVDTPGTSSRRRRAATKFAPELGPTSSPCSRASRRISVIASSLCTAITRSTNELYRR